ATLLPHCCFSAPTKRSENTTERRTRRRRPLNGQNGRRLPAFFPPRGPDNSREISPLPPPRGTETWPSAQARGRAAGRRAGSREILAGGRGRAGGRSAVGGRRGGRSRQVRSPALHRGRRGDWLLVVPPLIPASVSLLPPPPPPPPPGPSRAAMGAQDRPQCHFDIEINREPVGRIMFQLFSDICPKTCKNFLSLCSGEWSHGLISLEPFWEWWAGGLPSGNFW
uniref:PPIase cyclophilin-type domain-containing protein n=1 Tax=Ornithorhynchus anatinus TaxID=9258 RepID=A0A6I8PNJ2_ORNAN